MRLKDVYTLCKKNHKIIEACKLVIDEEMCECYLHEEKAIKEALVQLSVIKYLNEPIDYFYKALQDIEYFEARTKPKTEIFDKAKNNLTKCMNSVIELYESLGLNTKDTIGVDIKLPKTENLSDFKRNIDDLEFVFTKCPFFQSEKESLCFGGLDVGSEWLALVITASVPAIVLSGSILLNNIAAFIDKCLIIKSHKLTIQQQKNLIESSQVEQKEKEELIKNLNRILKIQIDNEIKSLEEESGYNIVDGDERGRVEQSFEKLEKLIDKGLQIYSSIDSPPETKALFKPIEMQYLSIAKELKAIEKKSNKDNND